METASRRIEQIDRRIVAWLQRNSITLLRGALGIVFVWFGLLKVFGRSPVLDLVSATVYWTSPGWFVPFLGVWETLIGLGLLFRVALRAVVLLALVQLGGTFLVLLLLPGVAFAGSPLLLTQVGEFVIKNLVLLSAVLVVGSTVRGAEQVGESPPARRAA